MFGIFDLRANRSKTIFFILRGHQAPMSQTDCVYNRIHMRKGKVPRKEQWTHRYTVCPRCGVSLKQKSLRRYWNSVHNERITRCLCRSDTIFASFCMEIKREIETMSYTLMHR